MSQQPEYYLHLAEWMDEPISPGRGRALKLWLEEERNQKEWDAWQLVRQNAKDLQVTPPHFDGAWSRLKNEVGLQRAETVKRKSSTQKKASFTKRPLTIAVFAMIVFSLFLALLYFMRSTIGFVNA
ncbi:MAG: hypothetical protein AAGI08_00485 [Bacteroidota bacterium]